MSTEIQDKKFGVVDQPVQNKGTDYLKLKNSAVALCRFIRYTPTPMTIGIQGSWGTGKTSLLNMIEDQIEIDNKSKNFVHIKINAWEHSLLSRPEETLFKIVNDILSNIPGTNKGIKNHSKSLLKQATRLGAATMGAAISNVAEDLLTSENTIRDLKKDVEKTLSSAPFEKAIIYIDDLDRINPPDAVAILELLKNIFDLRKCIFVLAIDYDVVVKGLRSKYNEQSSDNEYEYRAFFDKIIQLPFQMPISQYSIGEYVKGLMEKINYFMEDELDDKKDINEIEFIIKNTIGENPRSIKRLINYLSLIQILQKQENQNFESKEERMMLFAILSLQIAYPDIYSVIERDPLFKVDLSLTEDYSQWDDDVAFKHTHLQEEGSSDEEKNKFDNELARAKERESEIFDDDGTTITEKLYDEPWEQALFRICYTKKQLRSNADNVSRFLNYFYDTFMEVSANDKDESIDRKKMYANNIDLYLNTLNISSVTSVSSGQESVAKPKKANAPKIHDGLETYFQSLTDQNKFQRFYNDESKTLLEHFDNEVRKLFSSEFNEGIVFSMISDNGVSYNFENKKGGKFLNIDGGYLKLADRNLFKKISEERYQEFENHKYFLDIDLLKPSTAYKGLCKKALGYSPFQALEPRTGEFYTVRCFTKEHINKFLKSGLIERSKTARELFQKFTQKQIKNKTKGSIAHVRIFKNKQDYKKIISKELINYYKEVKL